MALTFLFKADGSQYTRGLEKMRGQTRAWSGGMAKMIVGAFAAGAVVGAIKKMIDASSDLSETISKSRVVFGEHSAEIEGWANTLASRLGQSKAQALDAAAGFASMFHVLGIGSKQAKGMSVALVELASDMASFHNTSVEEALAAIGSGLRGEAEPLRKYNVLLNDATLKAEALSKGLFNGKGALGLSTKAQAAYNVILEQSAVVNGDFVNTSDGLANSTRIMKAEITNLAAEFGDNLVPSIRKAMGIYEAAMILFNRGPFESEFARIKVIHEKAQKGGVEELERDSNVVFSDKFKKGLTTFDDSPRGLKRKTDILKLHGFTMLDFYRAQAKAQRRIVDEEKEQLRIQALASNLAATKAGRQKNNEKAAKKLLIIQQKITAEIEKRANLDRSTKQKIGAAQSDLGKADEAVEKALITTIGDDSPVNQEKLADAELRQQEAITKLKVLQNKLAEEESAIKKKILDDGIKDAKARLDNEAKINKPFEDIKAAETNVIASSLASIGGGGNVASFTSDPVLAAQIESNKILLEIKNNTKPTPAAPTVPEI